MAVTTEPAWLNKTSGIAARNGTTSHTISFGFTSTSGSFLVVFIYGAVTHAATGWTEQLQPVSSGELSVFTKTSAGDTSIALTHNGSDYPVAWVAYEFPAGATYTAGVGASPTTDTFAALTGLPGTAQVVIAARGRATGASDASASSVWSAPWVEDADLTAPAAATDGTFLTVAHQLNVTATSVTPATTTTYVGTFPADRQHVTVALNVPAIGVAAVSPSGISSAQVFGVPVVSGALTVAPAGISSAEAFGAVQIQNVLTLSPSGIVSAQAFGTPVVTVPIQASPSGVASGQAFGAPAVSGSLTVSPGGIATAQAFGTVSVSSGLTSTVSAISSAEAFGTPTISAALTVSPVGVPSVEAFGTPSVVTSGSVTPAGIPSAQAFGTPVVTIPIGASPTGIPSAEALGAPTVSGLLLLAPSGIASAGAFGTPSVSVTTQAAPVGIGSLESFGAPVVSGALIVILAGIASAETFGVPVAVGGGVVIPFRDIDLQVHSLTGSPFTVGRPTSNPFTVSRGSP